MACNCNITLVITSCGRHDLLRQTLESFYNTVDMEPREIIIIEDSDTPQPDWTRLDRWRTQNLRWISNGTRLGQIYSIDRAYREVKTDYIFHCEDDWNFTSASAYLRESKAILDAYPEVHSVSLRGTDCNGHPLIDDPRFPFKIQEPNWRGVWGHFSFNPGLRRMSDYHKIGSYGQHTGYGTYGLTHEKELSRLHADLGYVIAALPNGRNYAPYIEHTGAGRSRSVEPLNNLPKLLIAVPTSFKLEYGKYQSSESPLFDAARNHKGCGYGVDIHWDRDNDQTQAVRDTWFKDVAKHANVSAKFFFGKPAAGYPREPLADEVFLDVPDDYASLAWKTRAICKYALEHEYDFLFKCDSDTAVYVHRLVGEMLSNRFLYAGYTHGRAATGGPGYFLARIPMALVSQVEPTHWAEDMSVSSIMVDNHIQPDMLTGHKCGFNDHFYFKHPDGVWFDPSRLTPDVVTMHAVFPKEMREWYEYICR